MSNIVLSIMLGIVVLSSSLVSVYAQPPFKRVLTSEPVLKDQSGRELFHVGAGEVVLIESVLTSIETWNQTFAYIVQIKDEKEVTVLLSWLNGQLLPKQELKASQSWIAPEQGRYFIDIFVWRSVDNPLALSPVKRIEVQVFHASQPLPFDFTISIDPQSLKIQKGRSAEVLVTVEPIGEEIYNVRLLFNNVPNGISVLLEQDFIGNTPPYSIPVGISVADTMALKTYSFDIIGESGATQRSVTVTVTVVKEDLSHR